jgi:hypothetical protein
MRAGHRRGPGFVDEDEGRGIKVELVSANFAPLQDIGPLPLARVGGLFCPSALAEAPKRGDAPTARQTAPAAHHPPGGVRQPIAALGLGASIASSLPQ